MRKARGGTEILVLDDTSPFPGGTLIRFSNEEMRRLGTLSFTGKAEIGNLMSTGAKAFLLEGNFAVREIGWLSRKLGRRTNVVKRGGLTRGDVVAVVSGSDPAKLANGFGHMTLAGSDGAPLNFVFLSSNKSAALRTTVLGQENPALLEPTGWSVRWPIP